MTTTPHAVLGVPESADAEAIRRAFRKRAFELHPDRNAAPDAADAFRALRDAYDELTSEDARAASDAERIAADLISAADEVRRRRSRAETRVGSWERVRFAVPATLRDRFARGYSDGDWAVEAHPAGLDDRRWGARIGWDAIEAVETDDAAVRLTLTREAADALRGAVPARAFAGAQYRIPTTEPARLAAIARRRAGC